MGPTHLASGAVVGLLVLPQFGAGVLPTAMAVSASAGAALWPDIDQPQSSVAHTFYWPGHWLGKVVGDLAGGHRHATHSVLAAIAAGLVAYPVGMTSAGRQILLLLMLAPALHVAFWKLGALTLLPAAVLAWADGPVMSPALLAAALTIGWLAHLAGDALTAGGVPLLWPMPRRMGLPVLGTTGGVGERMIAMPVLGLLGLYGLVQTIHGGF